MNIKPLAVPVIVIVLAVGAGIYLTRKPVEQFGAGDTAQVQTIAIADISSNQVGKRVAIEGTIDQECPHSGCWAVIKDASGQIRIDTQAGGFALPLRREGSRIRIVGTVMLTEGGSVEISAESAEL
jgi:uncharacterized protein YdeI (BOF family)